MMVMPCGTGALPPIDRPPINIYLINDARNYVYMFSQIRHTDDGYTQKVLFTRCTRSFQFKQIDEPNGRNGDHTRTIRAKYRSESGIAEPSHTCEEI